jgi:glucan endo-1,3-alpha-glucosidase
LNMFKGPNAPTATYIAPTGTPTPIAASALPTGWSALGCHADSSTARALGGGSYTSNNLTVGSCIASCAAKGMPYAGVEYGVECWCSPASAVNLNPASDGCNVRCSGDPNGQNTVCGGGYRINVFQNDALIPASSATSAATSTAAPTTTSSRSTTLATTSTATKTSTSSSAASSASASAAWQSLGCTSDSSTNRVLVGSYMDSGSQTPQLCIASCQSKGYTYAGLQYGRQCYCSNTMVNPKFGVTGCTTVCAGDKNQMCGGAYRMNIYGPASSSSSSSSSSSTAPATTAAPTTTGGDQIVYRTVTVTSTVTVNTCQSPAATLTKRMFEGRRYPVPRNIRD